MNIQMQKDLLVQQILSLQDSFLIEKLQNFLNKEITSDWYNELSYTDKKAIEKSIAQADKNQTISHEEAIKRVKLKIKNMKNGD